MRKPRDIDAELKALADRQKQLKSRRTVQLGTLVAATGADSLNPEILAGLLLDALDTIARDSDVKEAWRRKGETFFRRERRAKANGTEPNDAVQPEAGTAGERNGPTPHDGDAAAG